MVARCVAADALVLFHDLLSPDMARGLGLFRDAVRLHDSYGA
jgi:hypothetical protein